MPVGTLHLPFDVAHALLSLLYVTCLFLILRLASLPSKVSITNYRVCKM